MTLAVAAPPAVAAELILARLAVPSKNPPAPSAVRRDVGKLLYGRDLTADEFAAVRDDLVAAGLLATAARGSVRLTDAGRARAMAFLGIGEFPPRTTWRAVQAKYLFPKAAGLSAAAAARLDSGDKVRAFLVKREYDLPSQAGNTISQVMEAIVCSRLGRPEEVNFKGLLRTVLSQLIGAGERLTKDQLKSQLPRRLMGTADGKPDTLRAAVIREWLSGSPPESPPAAEPAEFDLSAFARTVRALARTTPPEDRFGGNKVFIAAVWRASQREHGFPRLSLPEFKARLVEANRDGLLRLSRADLVQAMHPARVAESETHYLNATFHFVLIEGDQP